MGPKLKPQGFEDLLHESLDGPAHARASAAPTVAKVQRRGNDAILDSDDCEIIVYELFGDRA
ncbi:MAG: hypothetical protein HYT80_09015 [Euryarchaeota archaeon]|nr:hypothetical protein [Euryarchaeota archaeon]